MTSWITNQSRNSSVSNLIFIPIMNFSSSFWFIFIPIQNALQHSMKCYTNQSSWLQCKLACPNLQLDVCNVLQCYKLHHFLSEWILWNNKIFQINRIVQQKLLWSKSKSVIVDTVNFSEKNITFDKVITLVNLQPYI